MQNARDLINAANESAAFIEASLADNGKPDMLDLFKGMPMVTALKDAVVDIQKVPAEMGAASEEEIRAFGADIAAALNRLCKAIAALVAAVQPA